MHRRVVRLATLFTALALTAAACGVERKQRDVAQPEARVDVLRLALSGEVGYPNPFGRAVGGFGMTHSLLLYDSLLWKDATGAIIPWLAKDWGRSADGKQIRFTLRDDVRWHDGTPLTAEDVVFSFDYYTRGPGKVGPERQGPVSIFEVVEATAPGRNEVVLTLERPNPTFQEYVAGHVQIIPKHVWSGVADPLKYREPAALMGSGPYRIDSLDEAAGTYLYTANEDYFLGPPHVKRIEFAPAPNALLALERGEIDMAEVPTDQGVPDATLERFKPPEYGRLQAPGETVQAVYFNQTRGFPYTEIRFRQAIAHALDRQDLINRILFGRGTLASFGGLASSHRLIAPGLPTYPHDLAKARALLDQVGVVDSNGDGIRELPGGAFFHPEILALAGQKTAELVKEQLLAVGIDVGINTVDTGAFRVAAGNARYDWLMAGYGALGGDPDFLRQRLNSTVVMLKHDKVFGWVNPAFDATTDQAREATTEEEFNRLVQEAQRIAAAEAPWVPLFLPDRLAVYDRAVFDAWYYTPGGVFGGYPGVINKQALITGKKVGL